MDVGTVTAPSNNKHYNILDKYLEYLVNLENKF
jgi:hypothetical protein